MEFSCPGGIPFFLPPSLWQCSDSKPVSLEIGFTLMTLAWGAFSAVEECRRIPLSLLQLLSITAEVSIALFLNVGLIIYTCCHATLCFTVSERWDAEQWQSLRGDQGILGFPTKHSRGLQSPGQSGRQPGWQPVLSPNTSLSSFIKTLKTAWKVNQLKFDRKVVGRILNR